MAVTDPIGDLLTRIRNGQLRGLAKVKSPNSRLRARLLDVLKEEGFIRGYTEVEIKSGAREIEIELKYHEGQPVIRELKRVSTPGRRVYTSVRELKPHRQGLGVSIVSTPQTQAHPSLAAAIRQRRSPKISSGFSCSSHAASEAASSLPVAQTMAPSCPD